MPTFSIASGLLTTIGSHTACNRISLLILSACRLHLVNAAHMCSALDFDMLYTLRQSSVTSSTDDSVTSIMIRM